ncbi:hypothetical protein CH352_14430 [Leptospira hartskeerlii]|uniref:DUF2634 domain-containing protein n=1 Tax=Leptospira hartskeerlii TaxID=2023177 RepID=A0A2M9X9M8_9LEPT|nr:hypothetical protein [Leptospira hartskeerlii]PJZ24400.1 hypothetical protein CH357_15075 [Leptospira hartskeerlii]PJZ32988.1 hypothetical protein CH352_14430 [Leptospira hartskeerlii]
MKTFKIENNDLVYTESQGSNDLTPNRGRLVMLEGVDALRQILGNRLKMFLGEWYLAPNEGVDWLSLVDQKIFVRSAFLDEVRKAILKEPAVTKIVSLDADFDPKTRRVSIQFEVESKFGTLSSSAVGGV